MTFGLGQGLASDHRAQHISADLDVDPDGVITRFDLVQSGAEPGAGERRPHRLAVGLYDRDEQGRLSRVHRVELDVTGERTPVPDLVGRPRGALVLVNDDDLTYCKARLDRRRWRPRSRPSARSPSPCPAPCSGRRSGR